MNFNDRVWLQTLKLYTGNHSSGGNGIKVIADIVSGGSSAITSVIPGTAASNLGKAEDSPHTSGDVGVLSLAVRNDSGTVLAGSDLDYIPLSTDSLGNLRIASSPSFPSTVNSTSSPLANSAVFTGTLEDVINYSEIRITVFTDQVSATDGLSIQQSSNGTNWDVTDTYTIPASIGKTFVVPRQARYFRIVYTNGAVSQGSFRLQAILNKTGTCSSSQRSQDGYTNETDLQEVWAFTSLWNGTTWDRLRGDSTNGLKVQLPSGTETPSSSSVSGSGASPVAAGKLSVTFTTDSSFSGTILGVPRNASTTYSFSVSNPGKTLAAIAYTVTAGSMIIDVIA